MTNQFDIIAHLHRQREFSIKTFGPMPRIKGVLAHVRKELDEIENRPEDVEEWADALILIFDGAMRAGHTPVDVVTAIAEKQDKNERRIWPDWRDVDPDKPIEHVRGYHD
jgi:hypothetical protein